MKRIKRNVIEGYKSNAYAVATVLVTMLIYIFSYISQENEITKILIDNEEVIITTISPIVLYLIFGVKK